MWLLLPEELCTQRMREARQGFLEFVQANKEWYEKEPVKDEVGEDGLWFAKEAWGGSLQMENPVDRLPREPRPRRGR